MAVAHSCNQLDDQKNGVRAEGKVQKTCKSGEDAHDFHLQPALAGCRCQFKPARQNASHCGGFFDLLSHKIASNSRFKSVLRIVSIIGSFR